MVDAFAAVPIVVGAASAFFRSDGIGNIGQRGLLQLWPRWLSPKFLVVVTPRADSRRHSHEASAHVSA